MHIAEPPECGSIEISFPVAPVSLQAKTSKRAAAQNAFSSHLPTSDFLLSGDVAIEIEWMIHECTRYETAFSPDIDNVLKPFVDTLCGPQALLINDTQVQSVSCSWIDWERADESLNVRLRFSPDDYVHKGGLVFVEIGNSLCYPLYKIWPAQALHLLWSQLKSTWRAREELMKLGANYSNAKYVMPAQRLFHRAHLGAFEVMSLAAFEDFLREANNGMQGDAPPAARA